MRACGLQPQEDELKFIGTPHIVLSLQGSWGDLLGVDRSPRPAPLQTQVGKPLSMAPCQSMAWKEVSVVAPPGNR